LAGAFAILGNSTDSFEVNVAIGTYSGDGNCNIAFPASEGTLERDGDDGDVIFNCEGSAGFTATYSLDIEDITFMSFSHGIIFVPTTADQTLKIDNSNFTNCDTGIYVSNGGILEIDEVNFQTGENCIHVTNSSSVTVDEATFMGCTVNSIWIDFQGDITEIKITNSTFSNTAGVLANVGNEITTEGDIEDCIFSGITSQNMVVVYGGTWHVTTTTVTDSPMCVTAFSVNDAGNVTELALDTVTINTCATAFEFNADGSAQISKSTINSTTTGFISTQLVTLLIEETEFTGCSANSINVNSNGMDVEIEINDCQFNMTGAANITVTTNSTGSFDDCTFTDNRVRALAIAGGNWVIEDSDFTTTVILDGNGGFVYLSNDAFNNLGNFTLDTNTFTGAVVTGNGGAVYLDGTSTDTKDCTFTGNSATSGGAIFATAFGGAGISFSDSTFTNNSASANGGAIDLENSSDPVYIEKLTFESNTAVNGSAISCCDMGNGCNVTLTVDSDTTITLTNNVNSAADGADVTCPQVVGDFVSVVSEPDVDVSPIEDSSNDVLFWVIVTLIVVLVIGLIIAAVAGAYFYKKRMSYSRVD